MISEIQELIKHFEAIENGGKKIPLEEREIAESVTYFLGQYIYTDEILKLFNESEGIWYDDLSKVTAELVETKKELEALKKKHYDFIRGYGKIMYEKYKEREKK